MVHSNFREEREPVPPKSSRRRRGGSPPSLAGPSFRVCCPGPPQPAQRPPRCPGAGSARVGADQNVPGGFLRSRQDSHGVGAKEEAAVDGGAAPQVGLPSRPAGAPDHAPAPGRVPMRVVRMTAEATADRRRGCRRNPTAPGPYPRLRPWPEGSKRSRKRATRHSPKLAQNRLHAGPKSSSAKPRGAYPAGCPRQRFPEVLGQRSARVASHLARSRGREGAEACLARPGPRSCAPPSWRGRGLYGVQTPCRCRGADPLPAGPRGRGRGLPPLPRAALLRLCPYGPTPRRS